MSSPYVGTSTESEPEPEYQRFKVNGKVRLLCVNRRCATPPDSSDEDSAGPSVPRPTRTLDGKRRRGKDRRKRKSKSAEAHGPDVSIQSVSDDVEPNATPAEESQESAEDLFILSDNEDMAPKRPTRYATDLINTMADWKEIREKVQYSFTIYRRYPNVERDCILIRSPCEACPFELNHLKQVILTTTAGSRSVPLYEQACALHSPTAPYQPHDLIQFGYWPLSPSRWHFIEMELMEMLSSLTNISPVTSTRTLVSMLNGHSCNQEVLQESTFQSSLREYRQAEYSVQCLKWQDPFECPACTDSPLAIHVDGNMKLYRYSHAGKISDQVNSSHPDPSEFVSFLGDDKAVDRLVTSVRGRFGTNTCGDTVWKSGKSSTSGKSTKIAETGLSITTCRHGFALKAINMFRGEIYAYTLYQQLLFPKATFLCSDVACLYFPWLKNVRREPPPQAPFLSVMHAKAHTWSCQLTWGGRFQEGSGLSTGETTELFNSYISRFGIVTRTMSAARVWREPPNGALVVDRSTRLTEAAAHWNQRKMKLLPSFLQKQFVKASKLVVTSEEAIRQICTDTGLALDDVDQLTGELIDTAKLCQTTKTSELTLEDKIERTAATCKRLIQNIAKVADSGKGRAKLKSKLGVENRKLATLIDQYGVNKNLTPAEKEAVGAGKETLCFPWIQKFWTNGDMLTFTTAHTLANHVMNARRAKEEVDISKMEMEATLGHLKRLYRESKFVEVKTLHSEAVKRFGPILRGYESEGEMRDERMDEMEDEDLETITDYSEDDSDGDQLS